MMVENLRETDRPESPAAGSDVPEPAEPGESSQEDEHAAMRETVARQYQDALGKRYEPPDEDGPEPPRFDDVEVSREKLAGQLSRPDQALPGVGLGAQDAALVEQQIRAGVRNGRPQLGEGGSWTVDVPVSGPSGTVTVRTSWTVDAVGRPPRLAGLTPLSRSTE